MISVRGSGRQLNARQLLIDNKLADIIYDFTNDDWLGCFQPFL